MQLPVRDFPALVRMQAAAARASCKVLLDVTVGSVLRAVIEANASVALWMQWLILEVLATTRAATSQGASLDSWVADFGLQRLPAAAAAASVRFSRVTAGFATVVPVGATVRTLAVADAQSFVVVGDPSQPNWTGSGYAVPASVLEVVVPTRAVMGGWGGNVQAGALRLLSTAVPGIDAVVNDYAAHGGLDAESDAALRGRFSGFLDSRTRATPAAVMFAIQSVQQGLLTVIAELVDAAGAPRAGHFTIVLDDGSGGASDELIGRVSRAVDAVRPVGGTFSVVRPRLVQVNVSLRIGGPAWVIAAVQAAVGGVIQGLGIGAAVHVSRLVQAAHAASGEVAWVSDVRINGSGGDFGVERFGRPVVGTVTVSL